MVPADVIESSCQELLDKMEVSTRTQMFAVEGSPGSPVIRLPKLISSGIVYNSGVQSHTLVVADGRL